MKRKMGFLRSLFNKKGSTRKNILLSVVALIEIIMIMVVSTSAWVETISTIEIESVGGKIETPLLTKAEIGTGSSYNQSIDLTGFYRESGNVHLTPASSADGVNIFFPRVASEVGSTNSYRKGSINDKNVNYISFSFEVEAKTEDYDLYFIDVPQISVGETRVTNNDVRVAITTESDGNTNIYSNNTATESVVSNTNGTKSTTTIKAFSDYCQDKNTVLYLKKGNKETVTVTVWLQETDTSKAYEGSTLSVKNFVLSRGAQKYTITAYAVTNNVNQSKTGGTVSIDAGSAGSASKDAMAQLRVTAGTQVTLKAEAATGYEFAGWYDRASSGQLKSSSAEYKVSVSSDTNVYAIFKKIYNVTLHAVTNGTNNSSTGGTVRIGTGTASNQVTSTALYGDSVTLYALIANTSQYSFEGWYTAYSGGTQRSTSTTYSTTITSDLELYGRFITRTYTVTAHAVTDGTNNSSTGGRVSTSSTTTSGSSTAQSTVQYGGSATFYAYANSGYKFDGWYDSLTGTRVSTSTSRTVSSVTADKDIYAKFIADATTTTIYFKYRNYDNDYKAWVFSDVGANYSGGDWPGLTAEYDADTGYYKYQFTTSDPGKFKVIISDNGSNQYPSSGGLEGDIGGTYLFDSGSPSSLTSYTPPTSYTNISIVDSTNGTWVQNGNAVLYVYDRTNGGYFKTTYNSSTKTYTARIPTSVTNITLYRCTPVRFSMTSTSGGEDSTGYWNSWTWSRGTSTSYTIT